MNEHNMKLEAQAKKRRYRLLRLYLNGTSQTELARIENISRQRVSVMIKKAIEEAK